MTRSDNTTPKHIILLIKEQKSEGCLSSKIGQIEADGVSANGYPGGYWQVGNGSGRGAAAAGEDWLGLIRQHAIAANLALPVAVQVVIGDGGDFAQGFDGEEALVACDQDVGEGHQALEDVVVDDVG